MNRAHERGAALMVVIILLLVLSAVGMSVILLMEEERGTTYDEMYAQDALYAAEIGLRQGERILLVATETAADGLLGHVSVASTDVVTPAVPVFPQAQVEYDVAHLGTYLTAAGVELANQAVTLPAPPSGRPTPQAFFSLYVRNNNVDQAVIDGDPLTDAREDDDAIVNLVAVGWVQFGNTVRAVKVLEEEYAWRLISQDPSGQKLTDAGGTSSGQFGG